MPAWGKWRYAKVPLPDSMGGREPIMTSAPSFLCLEQPCEAAVDWFAQQVSRSHMSVMRTFDLQVARQSQPDCPCPYHGSADCDCQLVVLLVYQDPHLPVTILAHGYNGSTWFSVVDTPQQQADPALEAAIRKLAAPRRKLIQNGLLER